MGRRKKNALPNIDDINYLKLEAEEKKEKKSWPPKEPKVKPVPTLEIDEE